METLFVRMDRQRREEERWRLAPTERIPEKRLRRKWDQRFESVFLQRRVRLSRGRGLFLGVDRQQPMRSNCMLRRLRDAATTWAGQVGLIRAWYRPHLERLYDYAPSRAGDLDQLEQIAMGYPNRERFLSEVTLDPPDATGGEAGRPELDEDYLILSTIHSAKGQEWDAVYVLQLLDGCIPSDMATGNSAQIEEKRRLLYVAITRAKQHLHLVQPLRFFRTHQHRFGSGHTIASRSRFLPDDVLPLFIRRAAATPEAVADTLAPESAAAVDIGARLRGMWG